MTILTRLFLIIVAALHTWFAALEMLFWTEPLGRGVFGTTEAFAAESAALALNQGLYNLFLVAGLLWAALSARRDIAVFFFGCVIVAGVVGALSVSPRIFVVQGVPAILGLLTLLRR